MKKHYTLFTLLALLSLSSIAQDEPRQPKQFYIGVFASPDLSFSGAPYPTTNYFTTSIPNTAYNIPKFGYTAGLEALYQINTHFALTLGVQYSDKGGKTKDIYYSPSPVTFDFTVAHFRYNYEYIDVPLRLDYYFNTKKVSPFITAGVSTNIFLSQTTNATGINGNRQPQTVLNYNTVGFSSINPQFQLGAGIDIMFNKSRLRIFPIYRVSIIKADLGIDYNYPSRSIVNKQITGRLYSIGLGINYFFRLSKQQAKAAPNSMRDL